MKSLVLPFGLLLTLGFCHLSRAANDQFNNTGGDALWSTPANWTTGSVPGSSDTAFLNIYSGVITLNTTVPSPNAVYVGQGGGSGNLSVITGASLTTNSVDLGFGDSTSATGTWNQSGGTVVDTGVFRIGLMTANPGNTSAATISGGMLSVAGTLSMGLGSPASMTVSGGSVSAPGTTQVAATGSSTGALRLQSGTFSTGNFQVGSSSGTGTGMLSIGGGTGSAKANVSWTGFADIRANTGSFSVIGSGHTITNTRANADGLIFNSGASLNFTFDTTGISTINLSATGDRLNIGTGAILNLNGTALLGGGTFTLANYSSLVGGPFAAVNYTGFAAGDTEMLTYGANSLVLTVTAVPEPGTVALLFLGLSGVAGMRFARRRS